GDHVSFHNPMYESLTLLAGYVPITSRLRLGTAVYLLALRPPAIAAKITSTLDVLSGGRLIFGVGVGGENPKEFELCGVPHAERGLKGFAAAHLAFVTVGRDYESAKAVWAEALTKRYAQNFEPLARKYGIIGTPEQCVEAIERFRAAGCNYVILNPIGPATQEREQVERLAADVVPRLARG